MNWFRHLHRLLQTPRACVGVVLSIYVLQLGVAMAAPALNPMQMICSGTSVKWVQTSNLDSEPKSMLAGQTDCPLCVNQFLAPPPLPQHVLVQITPAHFDDPASTLVVAPAPQYAQLARAPPVTF